jgi:transposase InsO family protein/transposase-like protein
MANPLLSSTTTPEERAAFRRDVMEFRLRHSLSETMARFGVSRTFLCKWQRRYRADPSDLEERSREPKKSSTRYSREERTQLKRSLLIDNQMGRKRNKLIPTIFRLSAMLAHRSYASIMRMANKLIGKCGRAKNVKTKKIRTGKCNPEPCFPGELVQVDMKCVPADAVVQISESEEIRKADLVFSARQHMEDMMRKLAEHEYLFPELPMIRYLKEECQREYRQNEEDIKRAALYPQKELKLYQYTAVDVKSRWVFRWMFAEHSELASLRFAMELVSSAPFSIRCIQTDNGSEFVSDYMNGHRMHMTHFQAFLSSNSILHKRIGKGKPWENAHVESQHRLDQERLYDTMCVGSLEEATLILSEYQRVSNLYPKPCLGMKSPMQMIEEYA